MPVAAAALGVALAGLFPVTGTCQITPAQASQLRNAVGDRVEALTILGGDYGIAAASFRSTAKFSFGESTDATVTVTKLGGAGEIHARVVLDFLNQLWKVQWIGIGASYLWGPNITGWSAGLDVVFRF
jgi:hypothetical protein